MVFEEYFDTFDFLTDSGRNNEFLERNEEFILGRIASIFGSPVSTFATPGVDSERYYVFSLELEGCSNQGIIFITFSSSQGFGLPRTYTTRIDLSLTQPTASVPLPEGSLRRSTSFFRESSVGVATVQYRTFKSPSAFFFLANDSAFFVSPSIGYIRPTQQPSWWDEDIHPYVISASIESGGNAGLAFNIFFNPRELSPYALGASAVFAFYSGATYVDTVDNRKDIVLGVPIAAPNSEGIYGQMPDDIGFCSAAGLAVNDELVSGSKTYKVISVNTITNRAVVLRTL